MKVNGCSPALQEQLTALVESGRIPHAMVLDGGASTADGVPESRFNLEIAGRLRVSERYAYRLHREALDSLPVPPAPRE